MIERSARYRHFEFTLVLFLLQVLARSSPTDKFNLVKLLKKRGDIVAVTGDFSSTSLRL